MEEACIPSTHASKQCSGKEEKQRDIIEDMKLASGEPEPILASVINHYAQTLIQHNIRNLGRNYYVISYLCLISLHNKLHICIAGYPINQNFNYDALLPLLHFHLNNAGDPFFGNSLSLSSIPFEVFVLDWFANLWDIEKTKYWGYVTTGGTEGNLHGLLVGREQFPDGILYTSQDSHYSIFKIARMYRMKCVKVNSLVSGEIDCVHLKTLLLAHKHNPAIINLNIGTTMKGGIDNLDLVIEVLKECDFTRDRFYIHCDGALSGMMLPFQNGAPKISFKKSIGSVTISGHKFLGCPIPCGVVITRLKYIKKLSRNVEYIASRDITITGSRSGHSPIFLWYALKVKGLIGLQNEVHKCIMLAHYLKNRLRDAGIAAMLNDFSNIVVFERPLDDDFALRWSLACKGNIAHVVVMQHVTIEMLDSFAREYIQKRSIWLKGGEIQPPCIANDIGAENCVCSLHK
ncbi:hypothetical protein RJT34_24909 [Clitoria ternatea]|uniref:Serine decarboxylase n=1 Tax=Clitoria ternatea TaxID=43366 RepID=A0AAN9IJL1_CLITE